MAERATDVLARMLELMALASRDGGIGIDEAAGRTESSPDRLLDDLRLVTAREYYHPPGWTEDIRIEIGADTIRVASGGRFDRPPALSQREALALGFDKAFLRKWEYYFSYCEAGFNTGAIDNLQIVMDKSHAEPQL